MEAVKNGHELVCCAHLGPPPEVLESNSYMFQSAASSALPILVEECLGVPLIMRRATPERLAVNTNMTYADAVNNDEVEDLFDLLSEVISKYNEVVAISCGALFSNYQRIRVEHVCSRLGLTPLSFLWRIPQHRLLDAMIADGVQAVLVKVAAPGLIPRKHLNRDLGFLRAHFDKLHQKFQFHICGEGGEYESLVVDCPLFKQKLVLDEIEIVFPDGDESNNVDEVGILNVLKCHAQSKEQSAMDISPQHLLSQRIAQSDCTRNKDCTGGIEITVGECKSNTPNSHSYFLPEGKLGAGGLFHLSSVYATKRVESKNPGCAEAEAEAAVEEALQIFELTKEALNRASFSPQDVVYVHLYLSRISYFARINSHYKRFFGSVLPPSRSCVATGTILHGRRVVLDLCAQRGSGKAMRSDENGNCHNKLREVMHVQGISYWAPVCVGPYSQANTIRGGIVMLAGQIGLDPPKMQLVGNGWESQLKQCWKNAASVLDALSEGRGGKLSHCLGALVYISSKIAGENISAFTRTKLLSSEMISSNGGITPGYADGLAKSNDTENDGYEDEETALEMRKAPISESSSASLDIPIMVVAIPEMPMGALCEVELTCSTIKGSEKVGISSRKLETKRIATHRHNMQLKDQMYSMSEVEWDCGYSPSSDKVEVDNDCDYDLLIEGDVRFMKNSCGIAWIAASLLNESSFNLNVAMNHIVATVLRSADIVGLTKDDILHVRLYYNHRILCSDVGDFLETSLKGALSTCCEAAFSVVPVLLSSQQLFTVQCTVCNLIQMETEMWIDKQRPY